MTDTTSRPTREGLTLYWGILHCHVSAGICHDTTPFDAPRLARLDDEIDQLYAFVREDRGFDFLFYADHHNMGRMVAEGYREGSPWRIVADKARAYHREGSFVSLPGYEFQDGMEYNVYLRRAEPLPVGDRWEEVLAAVEPGDPEVMLAAHNRPNPTDWRFPQHVNFRLIEILNDGSVFERWANQGLAAGHRAAFIGGSDDHGMHPGRNACTGVWARELTAAGIWEALWEGRTVAATGIRPELALFAGPEGTEPQAWMGARLEEPQGARRFRLDGRLDRTPLTVLFLRDGELLAEAAAEAGPLALRFADPEPPTDRAWSSYYAKLIFPDGNLAFTAPVHWRNRSADREAPRAPMSQKAAPPVTAHLRREEDRGARVGWHRFTNAGRLPGQDPRTAPLRAGRDMIVHIGPDPLLATPAGEVIAPCMDGIRCFPPGGGDAALLQAFRPEEDLSLLVTALVAAGNAVYAAGYRHGEPLLLGLRGPAELTVAELAPLRPYLWRSRYVTPSWLAGDGRFLYVLAERECTLRLPDGRLLGSCQEAFPRFPVAVAARDLGAVHVLGCDGELVCYDLAAGQVGAVRWRLELPEPCASLTVVGDRLWAYNNRADRCAVPPGQRLYEITGKGEIAGLVEPDEIMNIRGLSLAPLPDGRLAGIHNPDADAAATNRDRLNESGVLRLLRIDRP